MSDDEINRTSHRLDHRKGEEEAKDTQFSNTTEVTEGIAAIEPEHEKHEAKKDPKDAHDHKLTEEIAVAPAAVGASGFAFHEHLEKKEAKEKHEEVHGKKHRSLFD